MISMRDNKDVASYLITKHSWKGKYKRVLSVGTLGLTTYNPAGMEKTNQWPYSEIACVTPVLKGQVNNEFLIAFRRGKKVDSMKFSSDHRAEIITAALRFKEKFAETPLQTTSFNACKHHWSENKLPVVLEISQAALQQRHAKTNHVLASYEFKDMEALVPLSDYPGGFALVHGGFGRKHLFSVNKREDVMKKIAEQAWTNIGINIKVSQETITFDAFDSNKFGKFSSDEYITSLTEFTVQKITNRQAEPVKRVLGLTECCLIERDPNSYTIVTLKPLAEISSLIRSSDNPQLFCIEYVKGHIRQYTSTDRDALLASLLDGVRASGNRDIHVRMTATDRGKRQGPATVPVDEEVESCHLKYLQQPPAGWDFVEAVMRFNNNVAYSGLLHSVTQDGLFAEKKEKLIEGALMALMDKEGDQDTIEPYALEAQFQALRRLVASKIGFGCFLQLPKFRERLGMKVVKALKRNDNGVTHAAVDMICALMQPMHDDYDLRQEQMNKSSLLSSKGFLENLLDMFVQHVKQGTGALVVAAMLDFLTFALCVPYSETTDGSHFDMLLNMVADHGRSLFQLFQHPSLAIVKGAGLVMKAVIEEGDAEVSSRMQDLALAEGALPRHLHLAMFVQSSDSRLLAVQQLSRHLVSLWVTGHSTAMALLRRTLPSGLLAYLDSTDPVPVKSRDLINIRDNLKLAQDHSQKHMKNKRIIPSWQVVEKHVELALEHWRARMGLHKKENEKNQQRPVVLRKRRERIKSECNWAMFYYQFNNDHTKPNLIWNFKTREELRDALESEMAGFSRDHDLSQSVVIAWNHAEFEVPYECLSDEIKIGDYYLRLLLEEDEMEKNQISYIKKSYEFFNDLYHRFLLTSNGSMRAMCLQAMAIVYGRHHEDIGPFNDTRYVIGMLEKSSDRLERDRLLYFINKLLLNKKNVTDFIEANGVRTLVDLLTLAHLHTSRATVPLQSNVIEASPDIKLDCEKEWYYGNAEKERKGPFSFAELKEFYAEGILTRKTRCWAQGMDSWRHMYLVPQLKWTLLATGNSLMNESELSGLILSMLISICQNYPSRDSHGSIVRPLPKVKRILSDASCQPHIVQLLLTFDPSLVEQVAILKSLVMQDNSSMPKLYLSGFFYFILMYTGSNVLPIGNLLKATHTQQAFRSEDSQVSSITYRSILGQLLPEAMVCYLENHGPEKFAEIFLGEFDTPEAIWNNEMRRMMIEKIAAHIADFTPRLKSNTRALYQYCPIPMIQYPQLENELFCNIYYLRHLCDILKFPDWPIRDPVQLLRDVLEAWKQEIEKKPPPISLDEAYKALGLNIEDRCDETTIRKAYFRLAQKYHPDKNPDGREIFEKVNKAYEFLCSKSSRCCDGPDPQNIILILKTQAILFSRYKEELHPYKYAGYPMLIKTISMETQDELLFSKPAPLLPTATETVYHTVNCSALNAEELRREGGLQLLGDAFSRCVGVLNRSSVFGDCGVQVSGNVAKAFTVASQFPACRERLTEMPGIIKDLCRLLYYQHLSKLCVIGVECVSSLAVDEILQTQLFHAGVFFHLLLFLFNYDYTLEEGGVERSVETNQQEVNNRLAKLSVKACLRLGGYSGSSTPENHPIQRALRALLTPFICHKMGQLEEMEILKLLNCNSENPYYLWNNGTRAELTEYLKAQQQDMIRSGECDPSFGAEFLYSTYSEELIIGEIFIRIYNEQPTYQLENPRGFTLELLDYLGSQAQYLYSLMALKDSGVQVDHNEGRLKEIEMALEALRNVIHNNPGVEMQCLGHFKLLFSLLRLDSCTRVQELAVGVISGVTSNHECVADIAASDVLVYLLLVLKSLPSSLSQVVVLETMIPLMSNSKLVKEAMHRGAVLYLLDLFCNSHNGQLRELTAELLAKMTSDKLVGPKIRISLTSFLPQLFLDAMKDSPQTAVHMFEGAQENPELIWNEESRKSLSTAVSELAESHYKVQKDSPSTVWKTPERLSATAANMQGEVVVGGVYLRLFIQNPAWVLRRPREFLIELLDKSYELMVNSHSQEGEMLELVSTALSSLLQAQPALLEQVPVLGHIPRLVQTLDPSSANLECCARAWLIIFHQLSCSQGCVKCLCRTSFFPAIKKAMQAKPEMMMVACETLHRIFELPLDELIQQALEVQLVDYLLSLLESRLESISNPSSAKAQLVNALKAMSQSPAWGQQVIAILDRSNVWAEYRDQKHDLFLTPTTTAGYLTASANVAGYLTEGTSHYMPSSPPPMEDS